MLIVAINANHALLAKSVDYRAIYLSGGGVAAGSHDLHDLGINTLDNVLTDLHRTTNACDVPLYWGRMLPYATRDNAP